MKNYLLCFLVLLTGNHTFGQPLSTPGELMTRRFIPSEGKYVWLINVPGKPPDNFRMPVATPTRGSVILSNVPGYDWSFGCSPTSAAMMAGYYDRTGFPDVYTGPANGGVAPLDNSLWGSVVINGESRKQCPISATKNGVDGRTTRGHVDDYWVNYNSLTPDPYITNGWTQHPYDDCTADYMYSNQYTYMNCDGSTSFQFNPDGSPLKVPESWHESDGMYGLSNFFNSRGYPVNDYYNQFIYGYLGNTLGFNFTQYKQEINAGRPVLIQLVGHTMLGYGYDDATASVYLHDTWDYSMHSMTWGGSYSGMQQLGVGVLKLSTYLVITPTVSTTSVTCNGTTTATAGGVAYDGGDTITTRGVCWSTIPGPTISDSKTTDGGGEGYFASNLQGLTANTTYYFRAYATNTLGTSYGLEFTFTTLTDNTLPAVMTKLVMNINETFATCGGQVTCDGGSNVMTRGVCWSTFHDPTIADAQTSDGTGMGTFLSHMSGLVAGTTYFVRAYSTNQVGTAYGEEVSFTALPASSCSPITISHIAGPLAPVNKTVTYATIANIPGSPSKCWITSNLGSSHQATAVNDTAEASAGWYWQFNRKQGYQHTGITRTPNTQWIYTNTENLDWEAVNDPCAIEFGGGWRIPTNTEWSDVIASSSWTNWNGPWNSALKLHAAGMLETNGSLSNRGIKGFYWSSTQYYGAPYNAGGILYFTSSSNWMSTYTKTVGFPLRCIKIAGAFTPPTVSTTTVSNIGTNIATSGGNVTSDGGAAVTGRGVCWGINPNPSVLVNFTWNGIGTGTFTSNITGLLANTTYYTRSYATNSIGTAYGNELTFTTLPQPVLPVLNTTELSGISQVSATSGGNVTSDGGATVTARGVCWSLSSNPEISGNHTTDGSGTGSFTSNLAGLNANTTYHVRAYAKNSAGTAYGNELIFITLASAVLPAVTTAGAANITAYSAITGGNVTFEGGASVTARGVCWDTLSNPGIGGNHTYDGSGAGVFASSLTALTANKNYYVRAYATNDVGTSYGNELEFTTPQPPSCPLSLTINHTTGIVSPVNKTVTYNVVTNLTGEPLKCWIACNLGADRQATGLHDVSEASAGWYWQFNRKQGYKHTGSVITPAWTISTISENSEWIPLNDPCTIELGSGWRIPTSTEWNNVKANWTSPWNSALKLHPAGYLLNTNGSLNDRGYWGAYWSSTQHTTNPASAWGMEASSNSLLNLTKALGFPLRCLKEAYSTPVMTDVTGTLTGSSCYNATQTVRVAGNGTTFTIQNGGSATMIAGSNILLLPGASVVAGGYMWGYISPAGPYCVSPSMPANLKLQDEPAGTEKPYFKVYPNPTTGDFILAINGDIPVDRVSIDIFGMWGEKVLTTIIAGERSHEFSLSGRPSGVYFIRMISGDKSEIIKIIKQPG